MKRIVTIISIAVISLGAFPSCALFEKQANSEQTAAQLTALQQKAFDIAMAWLNKWLGGGAPRAMAARSAASPEDQFIAANRAKLQSEGISESDARIGFRAAQLKKF